MSNPNSFQPSVGNNNNLNSNGNNNNFQPSSTANLKTNSTNLSSDPFNLQDLKRPDQVLHNNPKSGNGKKFICIHLYLFLYLYNEFLQFNNLQVVINQKDLIVFGMFQHLHQILQKFH